MVHWLWLVPAFPFAGFLILALAGRRLSNKAVAYTGTLATGLSALLALLIAFGFFAAPPNDHTFQQALWGWLETGGFSPDISLYLDSLALIFVLVVTVVGFLIHLYSASFMKDEEGYARFFAYMNLFVGSMLLLVLSGNLLFLYLGWEAVGLCSYLLIGFWYRDKANGQAAQKAFIVTRVGDTMMAIGLFLLFHSLGTLNIQEVLARLPVEYASGSALPVAASIMLLGGAVGKSAQLPLQIWLPDAMAGPSPVSALIHAATMVTAGVYLVARTYAVFEMAPLVQALTAIIGASTLLLAGFSALTQRDIKKVLAYSTISQIGYMFLALGIGAWSGAVFHFMTHAFFKALLFLGAGVVIIQMHHEHDMLKMGGLRKSMPFTFYTFLAGAASLAALPLVTAGFYSKDIILWYAWSGTQSSPWLWTAGIAGSFLTALYTFRMVFLTFYGEGENQPGDRKEYSIQIPLAALAVLSIIAGVANLPENFGHKQWLSDFLHHNLPRIQATHTTSETLMQVISGTIVLAGILAAYRLYLKPSGWPDNFRQTKIYAFWSSGWAFDQVYHTLLVRPVIWLARINQRDVLDLINGMIARFHIRWHGMFIRTQTGKMRWYAMGIATGTILALAVLIFLT